MSSDLGDQSADDAENHSDVIILAAYCDEHYESEVMGCRWLHMGAALEQLRSRFQQTRHRGN
jgi:nickel-dependent lactate racemase